MCNMYIEFLLNSYKMALIKERRTLNATVGPRCRLVPSGGLAEVYYSSTTDPFNQAPGYDWSLILFAHRSLSRLRRRRG